MSAETRSTPKEVVIREGVKTYRVSPATFKQVTERVMVKPETPKFEIVPAVYEEREAELAVEQARTVLEPCRAAGTAYSKGTGSMTFCAKEIPAKAKTVTVKAMIEPETTKVIYEPAEYKEITRWILDKPAQVVEVMESEQVIEVSALEVVSPEKTIQRVDPAVTETMDVRKFEGQARVVSRRAVCDSDLNERFIRQLQNSLVSEGFDPGEVDGLLGRRTLDALAEYQSHNGLAVGAITYESLEALSIH